MEFDANYINYFTKVENGKIREGPPNDEDLENARNFLRFLRTFYKVTLKFSGFAL